MENVAWQPLQGHLSWYPAMQSALCISFEDRAPVDFIYGPLALLKEWLGLKDGAPEW